MTPKKDTTCPACNGSGKKSVGDIEMDCATCEGTGSVSGAQK